jgi:hypothetical protein
MACLYFGIRALMRGELRLSTLAAAPWVGLVALAGGYVLTFGTTLGERIVKLAKFDESAQTRVDAFRLFDYLGTDQLLYGVDFAEVNFLLKTYKDVAIIENCWIGILLMLGAVLFVVFALSLLGFFYSIARGRGALALFAIVNFLLVASTSNSLSTKTPSLAIFSIALVGIAPLAYRRRTSKRHEVRWQPARLRGGWS